MIEPVNTNLDGTLSLADKVWNDAMETAALRCEDAINTLRSYDNEASGGWVDGTKQYLKYFAQDFREMKRGLKPND
jgi:hypothetical protein